MKISKEELRAIIKEELESMEEVYDFLARKAKEMFRGKGYCAADPIEIPFYDKEDADKFVDEFKMNWGHIRTNEEFATRVGYRRKQMFLLDTINEPEAIGNKVRICAKDDKYKGWRESSFIARLIQKHGVTDGEGNPRVEGKHKFRFSSFGYTFSPMEEDDETAK